VCVRAMSLGKILGNDVNKEEYPPSSSPPQVGITDCNKLKSMSLE
jgi:hypothetical protein